MLCAVRDVFLSVWSRRMHVLRCVAHAARKLRCRMSYIVCMWCTSYADVRRACDCADEAAEEDDGDVEALKSHVGACRTEPPYGSTHTRKAKQEG